MKVALAFLVSVAVGIAVGVALWPSDYGSFETVLTAFFSAVPVFLLVAWLVERNTV